LIFALAAVKLPSLLASIRFEAKLSGPVEPIVVWLIDKAPTLDEPPAEVADRLMVLSSKVTGVPVILDCVIAMEPAVMAAPVKETSFVPRLIAPPAVRLVWVIPLAEVWVSVPAADKLISLVPLVMAPDAVKLV